MVDPLAALGTLVFATAFKKLIESYVDQRVKQYFANPASIKTDFEPHLKATFDKCTRIKTVLDGTKPLNMLDIYAGQNFEINKQHVDHYKLIEHIKNIGDVNDSNAYVLTGTGGGGKSMFMRYLWISLFVDSRGKIPFFLELRNFDKAKHSDLEDFIYQSVLKTGSTISKENFTNGLRAGNFYLLLDGFDEVAHDNRQELQAHIISLRENNPNVTLIISSRPDERFLGWNQFEIIKVLPLNEKQVRDLIKKAPFDREKKTTFLNNLEVIYQTHQSFLSTPLLAYMMLIAYADNQNLPDLMVDFYEQAFNALFERHDLMKNGFKRKLYCNLGRPEFKKLISLICLKSYSQEKYEFTQEEIETLIGEAQKPLSLNQTPQNVIRDLTESLCFLKREGLSYDFTHRSFQEYFAAYCLTWFNKNIFANVEKFSKRNFDSVVLMFYQLNPQLFRKEIIKPIYENNLGLFNNYDHSLEFILNYFKTTITIVDQMIYSIGEYRSSVPIYLLKKHIIFNILLRLQKMFNEDENIISNDKSFFADKFTLETSLYSVIYLQNSKPYFTFFDFDTAIKYFEVCDGTDIKAIRKFPSMEIGFDTEVLLKEFKDTSIYKQIIAAFSEICNFFTAEYNKYLQEEASADEYFDDF